MGGSMPSPSNRDRRIMLAAAFLGWLCAGVELGLSPLVSRPAALDLLSSDSAGAAAPTEAEVGTWFSWYLAAFLLGGAVGGTVFGRLGDRAGRVRAMGWSIVCFSVFTGAGWLARTPSQFLIPRFLAGLGVGGMWPAGVALVSEAWPTASRPMVAGAMGAAANVGILVMALIGRQGGIRPDDWRWAMLVGAAPVVLGAAVLIAVPESRRWLDERAASARAAVAPLAEVFRPPLAGRTILGIFLGAVPMIGTWASGKWLVPWAGAVGGDAAGVQATWALGAVIGGAAGGWLADRVGRRLSYFLISLATLLLNGMIYRGLVPTDPAFRPAVFALGVVGTLFFGWLPLFLPELFPTRVRATGAGVSYNTGRVASAVGVLVAGGLMSWFDGDYARVGEVTAWVYAVGMIVILFAPDTSRSDLRETEPLSEPRP
jgi:MFS transporter, SHS family, sialic acid transporter